MTTFAYQVRDKSGRKITGVMEAQSQKNAAAQLLDDGYLITSLRERKHSFLKSFGFLFQRKISADELTMFYVQLSNMVDAGVPLLNSLQAVSSQLDNRTFSNVVDILINRIQNGKSLSEAMNQFPHIFPMMYQGIVQVGETSGTLAETLRYAAELNESKSELTLQIRSSLAYPIVLMVASTAVVIFMLVWIVPTFSAIFEKAGVDLPTPTRILYGLSMWIKDHPIFLSSVVLGSGLLFRLLLGIEKARYQMDRILISIPLIGLLIRRIEISRWSRAMALMLSSGIPILKTLEISSGLTRNLIFKKAFDQMHLSIQAGNRLADTLSTGKIFPYDVIQMVSTGENSGSLDKMLFKISNFYGRLVTRTLKKLTGLIEPIFVVLMGAIVGFIMLSVLLPIFDMIKLFHN